MSKYINIQGKFKSERITGILKKKDGIYVVETKLSQNQTEPVDIPLEEVLEDFEDHGIDLKVQASPWADGMFKNIFSEGSIEFSNIKIHPDYKFASKEANEKFKDYKFGMMIHWGIYSQLGVTESWCANGSLTEQDFLDIYYTLWQVFNPVEFNADEWAKLAIRAGMQFFQLTTKHHDGFCMFNTKTKTQSRKRIPRQGPMVGPVEDVEINFSIMDTLFKRDIVGELIAAFRKNNLGVGLYYSHIDWNDPNFRWHNGSRCYDPTYHPKTHPKEWSAFIARQKEQLREIFSNYGPIDQMFFDASWPMVALKEMEDIILMCRKLQPDCMMSDRGLGPYGDFTSPERWIPDVNDKRLDNRNQKLWQVCDPIHDSWAYLPGQSYKENKVLLHNLIDAISKGGTYVFAVSPMANGKFPQETIGILEYMGNWLRTYGESIYFTRSWKKSKEKDQEIFYTQSKDHKYLYLIHFGKPKISISVEDIPIKPNSAITLLDNNKNLKWEKTKNGIHIEIPKELINPLGEMDAFALKIEM
jgi:alpha-L-fucosidase